MAIDLDPGNVIQWAKEGRLYHGFTGTLTTPEAQPAVALDRQKPVFFLRVPPGVVVVPIMSLFAPEATGAAVMEVVVSTANNDPGSSSSVLCVAVCQNTRYATVPSKVLAYGTNTGSTGTAPTGVADLFRHYQQVDNDAITGAPTPPIIYRPLQGIGTPAVIGSSSNFNAYMTYYANGTSSTLFTIHTWAEFTYDEFYA